MRGVSTSAAIAITTGVLFAASAGSAARSPAETAAQGPIEDLFAVLSAVDTVCQQAEGLPDVPDAVPPDMDPDVDLPDTDIRGAEAPGVDLPSPDIRSSQPPDDLTAPVQELCAAFEDLSIEELESLLNTIPDLPTDGLPEAPTDDLPELPGLE
ncbi:hypothetical protein GCM10009799_36130 [Nocardiopsis rhodophaea]|uniref:Secreted protein n=1 Tax=Nocardiopsis rhodophaea TaxID=280238 RepID=A0ABP5EVU8_9ACTN